MKRKVALPAALMMGVALMACTTVSAAECDPAAIGYADSRLGLDYRALAPAPVAEILSQAEAERLAAGTSDDLAARWGLLVEKLLDGTLPGSFTGAAEEPSLDDLRLFAPQALALLKTCGPDADPRLEYLRDISLSVAGGQE